MNILQELIITNDETHGYRIDHSYTEDLNDDQEIAIQKILDMTINGINNILNPRNLNEETH